MSSNNFAELLMSRCSSTSELIDAVTGEAIQRGEVCSSVSRAASFLLQQDLEPGDRIVLIVDHSPLTAIIYLGCIYAGLVAVPINASHAGTEPERYISLVGAKAVWAKDKTSLFPLPPEIRRFVGHITEGQPEREASKRNPEDLAVLVATSGTIGNPRFVMVTHANLEANTQAIAKSQLLSSDDRAMLILPISYCFGASILHSHLLSGSSVVFDNRFMFPDKVLKTISEYGCTSFAGVPSVFHILLNRSNLAHIPMPTLRRFLQAGGSLSPVVVESIKSIVPEVYFYCMYGQTEATARISCLNPEIHKEKPGSVGPPLHNLTVTILDDDGNELPPNIIGRVFVSGPSVCQGYWNDEENTGEIFQKRGLNTRDRGRVDEDGYLWIEGRESEFIKIRGRRVSCVEIEETVRQFKGVQDVGVCRAERGEAGEVPVIFVVPEQTADKSSLINTIRINMPKIWNCELIYLLDKLPTTTSGKINRKALASRAEEKDGSS